MNSGATEIAPGHGKNARPASQSVDSHSVSRRLQSELMALMVCSNPGISAFPDGDNIFNWAGTIKGSTGTVYEGLTYNLSLKFPADYPFKAPTVKFETYCFHPNVDQYGNICLDILKEKWSSAYDVRSILLSIQSLLGEPNNESPLNGHAAALWPQQEDLTRNPVDGFSAGLVDDSNVFEWQVTIIGPPDTLYEGGFFNAIMSFPSNYPNSPPSVRFVSEMWHPNVYPDGRVCISILHAPGDDPNGYELASERWTPVHTVETILLSIISMLSTPNDESPANIDAAKEWRDTKDDFKRKVSRIVRRSQEMM
eukprot:jgi/Mesen1/11015/ME000098S10410